jgi:hypothetical protein
LHWQHSLPALHRRWQRLKDSVQTIAIGRFFSSSGERRA